MADLQDFGSILRSGQAAVPDYATQEAQRQMAAAQITGANLANSQAKMQMVMQQRALQRQQAFGQDMGAFLQNPSAKGVATLFGKYPEFATQAQDAWSTLDTARRRSDTNQLGSAAALTAKGDYKGAAQIIQERVDADKQAGQDTTDDEHMLALLNSGDPKQQRAALGVMSIGVASAVGPEKAAEFLKANGMSSEPVAVGLDQRLVTPQGDQVTGAQPKLENVTNPVTGESTGFNPYTGTYGGGGAPSAGGGGQASGAGQTTPPPAAGGGMQASIAHVFHNEDLPNGTGYNPKDANGSPTNWGINFKANKAVLAKMGITAANFKNMTQDQAAQIYATKYWPQSGAANLPANLQAPYFDAYVRSPALAKNAYAQSGGDPAKFVQIASAAFQKMASNPKSGTAVYAHAWATRDAGNAATATGQAPNAVPAAGGAQAQPAADPYHFGGGATLNTTGAEPGHAWNATHTAQIPVPGTDADPASYAAEVDPAARNWIFKNEFPMGGGGMGGGGQLTLGEKNAIVQRGMQLWAAAGHSPEELKTVRSQYAGLNNSLQTATQTLSALSAAEDGLQRDANLVLNTHRILADVAPNNPHGMSIVKDSGLAAGLVSNSFANNTKLDWYETHGSPAQQAAVKAYKDAVNAYSTSYSKFMTAANGIGGSAAPSDAARNQAGDLNDEGLGPTALRKHLQTVLAEAENKRQGWQHQVELLNNKMNSLGNLPSTTGQSTTPPVNIPQGAVQMLKANPHLAAAFDQKYGAGKASQILGH